ncbi:hypothetical protein [Aeromicrobium sp. 179-A 4D2 NHS]|uniref:hypothetical protein n=1 Tax=Aeromicrobium sp. 179-A 4D2 NHS TaxID=3142375 RepID=UPI0039A00A27
MAFLSTPEMRVMAACFRARVPLLFEGSPGVGKSAKITSYLEKWVDYHDVIIGGIREATDFLGLPVATPEGGVVNYPPMYGINANKAKSAALLFDELKTAAPSTQKGMLRVIQEGVLGELVLGSHVYMMAAANPVEEGADSWDLTPPMANRFCHVEWKFDVDEWLNGVADNFESTHVYSVEELIGRPDQMRRSIAAAQVTGFLYERGSEFLNPPVPTNPAEAGGAWPSPRSWTNAIAVMAELNPRDEKAILLAVKGLVGKKAAAEFIGWRKLASLPNPDEVLADPENAIDWQSRPDVLFAIVRSVAYIVKSRGTKVAYEAGFKVMEAYERHNRSDVALPSLKQLILSCPSDATIPADMLNQYSKLFEQAGILKAA